MTDLNVGHDLDDLGTRPELIGWICHVCGRHRTLLMRQPCAVCQRNAAEWDRPFPESEQEPA